MMHDKYHDLLQQHIDGDLEPVEIIILEEHLATCQSCRKMLNQFKLMDWDLHHQPVIDPPAALEAYRLAAIRNHVATVSAAQRHDAAQEKWELPKHILKHTFAFVSYNPVNQTVASSVSKTASILIKATGNRFRKRKPLLSRLLTGQI